MANTFEGKVSRKFGCIVGGERLASELEAHFVSASAIAPAALDLAGIDANDPLQPCILLVLSRLDTIKLNGAMISPRVAIELGEQLVSMGRCVLSEMV